MLLGFIIIGFFVYLIPFFVRDLLIGKGKLKNPIYDTDEKKAYILKKSVIGLIGCGIGIFIFGMVFILAHL